MPKNKRNLYPYGIHRVAYTEDNSVVPIMFFGGKKIFVRQGTNKRNNTFILGFFSSTNTKIPNMEMIFNTTDGIDFLINNLKVTRKRLLKQEKLRRNNCE